MDSDNGIMQVEAGLHMGDHKVPATEWEEIMLVDLSTRSIESFAQEHSTMETLVSQWQVQQEQKAARKRLILKAVSFLGVLALIGTLWSVTTATRSSHGSPDRHVKLVSSKHFGKTGLP